MARKKKIVIVDKELTPTVLATIENKKTGLIGLVLLFIIFGGVVYYLPEISLYVENYLHPEKNPVGSNKPNEEKPNEDDKTDINETVKHPYTNTLSITEKDLVLSNFSIVDTTLNFRITNNSKERKDLATLSYYMELYNAEDTLLQRIKVDEMAIGANTYYDASYPLQDANVSSIAFLEIVEEEYPSFVAKANEQKQALLVCKRDNETVNYLLKNNQVYQIEDIFTLNSTDPSFATVLPTYQALATTYATINGITSNVSNQGTTAIFKTTVDLSSNNANLFINKLIYANATDAKVIRFELLARGYNCE